MQKLFRGPVVAAHSEDLTHFLEESPESLRGDNNMFGRGRTPVTPRMLHIARDVNEVACLDYLPLQPVFGLYKLFSLTREQVEVSASLWLCSGTFSPGCKVPFITP